MRAGVLLAFVALAATSCDYVRGEALIVVDTDMPVPKIVSELRVDIYSADGTEWWDSRTIPRPLPEQWPVSFSVYSDDMNGEEWALVRLRAYPSGYVEDYHGEGYVSLRAPGASPPGNCCTADCLSLCPRYWAQPGPRLSAGDGDGGTVDLTPATEPQPLVTIDRILLVHLVPGVRGKVVVTLAGACDGTQAILPDPARASPQQSDIQSCVDTAATTVPVSEAALDPDMTLPQTSQQGQFEAPLAVDCTNVPRPGAPSLHDGEVCVRGGAMIFGGLDGRQGSASAAVDNLPARIATVPSFVMDQYEFSVARYRAALAAGYSGRRGVVTNTGGAHVSTQSEGSAGQCTFTATPIGQESQPLNCVDHPTAQELCGFYGGSLPLEVQWEYAATVFGRTEKDFATYAPGPGGAPSCQDVAWARGNGTANIDDTQCFDAKLPFGVADVDFGDDTTDPNGAGLFGMTGNVREHVADAFVSRRANCALTSNLDSPACVFGSSTHTVRGGSWESGPADISTASRRGLEDIAGTVSTGFRCVR